MAEVLDLTEEELAQNGLDFNFDPGRYFGRLVV